MVEPSNGRTIRFLRWMFFSGIFGIGAAMALTIGTFVISGIVLIFVSSGLIVVSFLGRDALEWKQRYRWQFSLRTLFIAITIAALFFGIIVILRQVLPIPGK